MKHIVGLMRESALPENGYELYFDEKPGMVRIRFFENLGPAELREDEEPSDSIRFRLYDTWEYDIEGIESYVMTNAAWLLERAKTEERQALALEIKGRRNKMLVLADYEVNKAVDAGDKVAIERARQYRQDLRDVPDQAGFPYDVDWPEL